MRSNEPTTPRPSGVFGQNKVYLLRTLKARPEISSKLPMGVPTKYNLPGTKSPPVPSHHLPFLFMLAQNGFRLFLSEAKPHKTDTPPPGADCRNAWDRCGNLLGRDGLNWHILHPGSAELARFPPLHVRRVNSAFISCTAARSNSSCFLTSSVWFHIGHTQPPPTIILLPRYKPATMPIGSGP